MKRLELALVASPVTYAPGDTLIVPIPADERPLRGDAGWIDWRSSGAISRQLLSGYVSGERGEVVLLPAERPLGASRILLVGLGPSASLGGRVLQRAFCTVAEKLVALRSSLALLALPGAVELELDGDLVVRGCVQALSTLRAPVILRIVVSGGAERARAMSAAVATVAPDAYQRRVDIDLGWLEKESDASHVAGPA